MMRKLTIIAAPICAVGHVNATAGLTLPLLSRGHRVIFLLEKSFEGQLSKLGFQEVIYEINEGNTKAPGADLADGPLENDVIGSFDLEVQLTNMVEYFVSSDSAKKTFIKSNDRLRW